MFFDDFEGVLNGKVCKSKFVELSFLIVFGGVMRDSNDWVLFDDFEGVLNGKVCKSKFVELSFLIVFGGVMRDSKPFTGVREEIAGLNRRFLKANSLSRTFVSSSHMNKSQPVAFGLLQV